jgi:DNA-binding XRE family transcriptional regulator
VKTTKFIESAIASQTDKCIDYPYKKNEKGYGIARYQKRAIKAHRLVLILTVGEPPSDKPLALHSCCNPSCVNPAHLRWGNAQENADDMIKDGNSCRGKGHWNSKLTRSKVIAIYQADGSQTEIAKRFGITRSTVNDIKNGYTWGWLTKHNHTTHLARCRCGVAGR